MMTRTKGTKLLLTMLLVLTMLLLPQLALAEEQAVEIEIHVSNAGQLLHAGVKLIVTDTDADGLLTISDALYAYHEAYFEGGAAAGYGVGGTEMGPYVSKFLGLETDAVGYYCNQAAAGGLHDEIKSGDLLEAFVYGGDYAAGTLEHYAKFNERQLRAVAGTEITLTLAYEDYDEEWNAVFVPLADAAVLVDGKETAYRSDEAGQITLTLDEVGRHIISASSETVAIQVPVAVVQVSAPQPQRVIASKQNVRCDGEAVDLEIYNIDGYNYFKLRDLAALLRDTEAKFGVSFDAETFCVSASRGGDYELQEGDLQTGLNRAESCVSSTWTLTVDGQLVAVSVYNIGGNNFFKLADLGAALGFGVSYDEASNTAEISSVISQ